MYLLNVHGIHEITVASGEVSLSLSLLSAQYVFAQDDMDCFARTGRNLQRTCRRQPGLGTTKPYNGHLANSNHCRYGEGLETLPLTPINP